MLPRKWASCGRRGLDGGAGVGAPDHLIGRRLDLLALEEVLAVLVAGEIDDAVAAVAHRLGDREQHGVAEAATEQQHVLGSGISVGAPVGPITTTGSPLRR